MGRSHRHTVIVTIYLFIVVLPHQSCCRGLSFYKFLLQRERHANFEYETVWEQLDHDCLISKSLWLSPTQEVEARGQQKPVPGVKSSRPYRSHKVLACDRCRNRKIRWVVDFTGQPFTVPCSECHLSASTGEELLCKASYSIFQGLTKLWGLVQSFQTPTACITSSRVRHKDGWSSVCTFQSTRAIWSTVERQLGLWYGFPTGRCQWVFQIFHDNRSFSGGGCPSYREVHVLRRNNQYTSKA